MPAANVIEIILRAQDEASGVIEGLTSGLNSVSQGLIRSGTILTAATAPIAAGLMTSVSQATQFNTAMTNVGAVLGRNQAEMRDLNAQVLELGSRSVAGPQAAAEAFYDIVGGVQDASTHMAILEAAMATSEAGAASLEASTSSLIAIMNSYGYEAEKAAFVSDTLTRTVGMGVGTMEEFASALPLVTSLAASNSVEFENVAASMAYMTTKGITATNSATMLRAVMTSLLNPNQAMTEALQAMGVESGSAALAQYGLAGTLGRLEIALGGSQDAMAEALGSVEALTAASILNQAEFEEFIGTFIDGIDGATAAAQSLQLEGAAAQGALLKSQFDAIAITIGDNLLPAVNFLTANLRIHLAGVFDWIQANPELTATIVGLTAALVTLGPAMVAIGASIAFIVSPIGMVVTALTLLGLAWATNFGGIQDIVAPALDFVGEKLDDVRDWITQFKLDLAAYGLRGAILRDLGEPFTAAYDIIDDAIQDLKITADEIHDWVSQFKLNLAAYGLEGALARSIGNPFDKIKSQVETAIDGLESIDVTGMRNSIVTSFETMDFSSLQGTFESHFDDIVTIAGVAAGFIFGGPIGVVIGGARLLASAIESDFLGIGTFIKESGIQAEVERVFNELKTSVETAASSIFGTPGQGGGKDFGETPELMIFGRPVSELIQGAATWMSGVGKGFIEDISRGLGDLGTGISEFVESLSGTETSGLLEVATAIGAVIGGVIGTLVKVAGDLVGGTLSGIGKALPGIGDAISHFISAISNAGEGDWQGALDHLDQVLPSLGDAFEGFTVGIADGLIGAIEDVLGLDLVSVEEGFNSLNEGLNSAWLALQIIGDRIGRSLGLFFDETKLSILNGIQTLRQGILDATRGTAFEIDIAPNLDFDIQGLRNQVADTRIADEIERIISENLKDESFDLSEAISFEMDGETVWLPLSQALSDPAIISRLSMTGRDRVEDVLRYAYNNGDAGVWNALVPVAMQLGFDIDDLVTQFMDEIIAAGDAQTYEADPEVELNMIEDQADLINQVADFIDTAASAQTFPGQPFIDLLMRHNSGSLISQIGGFIVSAAAAQVYNASSTANVTVNGGSINTSPLSSAVSAAIQGALSIASSIVSSFRLPGRAEGGPVQGGRAYIVGEEGPEIFAPHTNGVIIPNDQAFDRGGTAAGNSVTVNVQVVAQPGVNDSDAERYGRGLGAGILNELRGSGVLVS